MTAQTKLRRAPIARTHTLKAQLNQAEVLNLDVLRVKLGGVSKAEATRRAINDAALRTDFVAE